MSEIPKTRDNNISIWADDRGEFIIIGRDDTQPGEEFLSIPLDKDSILEWIKVLIRMLDDGDICDVPGQVMTCIDEAEKRGIEMAISIAEDHGCDCGREIASAIRAEIEKVKP